jgi:Tfp pilus assembly protein PilX
LVTLLVVMLLAGTVARSLVAAHRQSRIVQNQVQAQWLAEAALARGLARLQTQPDFSDETWRPKVLADQAGVVQIRVERPADASQPAKITAQAHYPDDPWQRASVTREQLVAPREHAP